MKILDRHQIQEDRWDQWVQESPAGFPYLYTWYLDSVAPGWQAMMWEDRLALPLYRGRIKKFIPALIMPPFIQRYHFLGPGKELQDRAIEDYRNIHGSFLSSILRGEREIFLKEEFRILEQPNRVLELSSTYRELRRNYSGNHIRNLGKKVSLRVEVNSDPDYYPKFLKEHSRDTGLHHATLKKLGILITQARAQNALHLIWAEKDREKLAGALIIQGPGRFVYVAGASTPLGRKYGAMYRVLDHFIQQQAGTSMKLDFEGSRIPGVDRFFKGFGARREVYFSLRLGILSWL